MKHDAIHRQVVSTLRRFSEEGDIVSRTLRFSSHLVKAGMKTTGKGSPAAREPIVNRTRNTSEITEDNTVKTTGNGSTNIGDAIMPRIKKRSGKDFVTKNKEKQFRVSPILGPGTKSLRNWKPVWFLALCGTPPVKT